VNFKIEVEVNAEMKVIWLRKQYQAYSEYESTGQIREAVWILQNRAIELKRYLRDNPKAKAALDEIERIAAKISEAINEGDFARVKELAEKAGKQRSVVAMAMATAQNVTDEARQFFLDMSDAIRALGGY
jgi:Tfp pilus assembly protein PilE